MKKINILYIVIGIIFVGFCILTYNTYNTNHVRSWSKAPLLVNHGKDIQCTVYCFNVNGKDEWALVYGNPQLDKYPLVRIQSQCITGIELDDTECDCKQNLQNSKKIIAENPNGGILFLLNQDGKSHGGVIKLKELKLRRQNVKQQDIINKLHNGDWDKRDYYSVKEMLNIIGANTTIRLITRYPDKTRDISKAGIIIKEIIKYPYELTQHNYEYLKMKKSFGYKFESL
jgi:GTP cyclohydrolase II